jgi:hypothetical protein
MPRVGSNAFHEQPKDEMAFVTYSKFAHGGFAEDDNIPGSAHIIYCYPVLLSLLQQRTTRTVPIRPWFVQGNDLGSHGSFLLTSAPAVNWLLMMTEVDVQCNSVHMRGKTHNHLPPVAKIRVHIAAA